MKTKDVSNKTLTKSNKHDKIIIGFIIIILISGIAFFAYFLDWLGKGDVEMESFASPPRINCTVEKIGDEYNVTVNWICPSSYDLDLKHFKIHIYDDSKIRISVLQLTDLLNNKSSNITFFDNDNNNALSKDDVITFKDGIVDKNWSFQFYYKDDTKSSYWHYF